MKSHCLEIKRYNKLKSKKTGSTRKFSLRIAVLTIFMLVGVTVYAQPDICPEEPCDNEVPITGIEYLLLAGGALGLRMINKYRKK